MTKTRRNVMQSIGVLLGTGIVPEHVIGESINSSGNTKTRHKNKNYSMGNNTYLGLPGTSITTLFANLPVFLNSTVQQPTILLDRYDYDRLQAQIRAYPDDTRMHFLAAIGDTLIQRGNLKTIDYSQYYPIDKQDRYIDKYWEALHDLPDHVSDQAAQETITGHLEYRRGQYQHRFRSALGNWELNTTRRNKLEKQQERFDSGTGDSRSYNENVFAQYVAGLEIRDAVNNQTNLHVDGVLGDGDSKGIATVLRESSLSIDNEVVSLGPRENTLEQVGHPHPDHPANQHELIEQISTLAQEATEVEDNDWFMVGSNVAVPMHSELVSITNVKEDINNHPSELAHEAQEVIRYLQQSSDRNAPGSMEYDAEKLEEEITVAQSKHDLENRLHRAADLANISDDIHDLIGSEKFSHASLMIAASVLMDPEWRWSKDDLYRKARKLQQKHRHIDIDVDEIEFFRNRGQVRRNDGEDRDWYHQANRARS